VGSSHDADNPIPHYRLIYIFRFLLALVNMKTILQESMINRGEESLSKIPNILKLGDVYSAMIKQIQVSVAAVEGHEGMVRMLTGGEEVNPDPPCR